MWFPLHSEAFQFLGLCSADLRPLGRYQLMAYIRQSFSLKYISVKHLVYLFLCIPLSIVWDEFLFRVLLQSAD